MTAVSYNKIFTDIALHKCTYYTINIKNNRNE